MEKGTEMVGTRIRLGFAVAVLGIALSGGVAGAEPAGCSFSDCADQQGEVEAKEVEATKDLSTTTTVDDVEAVVETSPVSSGGALPFTGGDVIGLTILGGGAIGAGAVLLRRTRNRSAA